MNAGIQRSNTLSRRWGWYAFNRRSGWFSLTSIYNHTIIYSVADVDLYTVLRQESH